MMLNTGHNATLVEAMSLFRSGGFFFVSVRWKFGPTIRDGSRCSSFEVFLRQIPTEGPCHPGLKIEYTRFRRRGDDAGDKQQYWPRVPSQGVRIAPPDSSSTAEVLLQVGHENLSVASRKKNKAVVMFLKDETRRTRKRSISISAAENISSQSI
ncbi:hypothetical protein EYF80_021037 [Liparis tanakae]|uniref:Uncharacterized protein n=1 Tax=Liparis tanakae TaxID=230148 RepID=A0A4Z2HTS9_9TELE|nr:hypothetical protein EYF80_021037 [Liparis tanakae]